NRTYDHDPAYADYRGLLPGFRPRRSAVRRTVGQQGEEPPPRDDEGPPRRVDRSGGRGPDAQDDPGSERAREQPLQPHAAARADGIAPAPDGQGLDGQPVYVRIDGAVRGDDRRAPRASHALRARRADRRDGG